MSPQPAKFAGSFFTAEPIALNRQVRLFVEGGSVGAGLNETRPMAIVSPHAGYRFSGAIAGQAYAAAQGHPYERIVILSPSHRYAFDGLGMPSWNQMQLPNGRVTVERLARNDLLDRKLIRIEDRAHENEHGIETQLPFLVRFFRGVPILPIVVGRVPVAEVARLVDYLATPGTLFVLSSDLTHFQPLDKAREMDAATARMIETADVAALNGVQACGWLPLAGFLASETGAGGRAVRLAMGDSSPVTEDTTSVVGYGAWGIYAPGADVFGAAYRGEMLGVARKALASFLTKGKPPNVHVGSFRAPLQTQMASFVTLTENGRLRGCIGSLAPQAALIQDIASNAIKAGTQDHRFRPLTDADQLKALQLKIAVLTKPAPISVSSRAGLEAAMVPGQTGVILQDQGKRGTFLPMVWDSLPDKTNFVDGLMVKAGLPKNHWSDNVKVWTFRAESFAEKK